MKDEARGLVLACLLALLAGAVDAIGFIRLGHLFVAFMGGNTTTLSVAAAKGNWSEAGKGGALVALFVAGAVVGGATEEATGRWHLPVVLLAVAILLALAAPAVVPPIAAMTLAMGALNAALHHAGPIPFGITYVTGVLGRLGQGLGRWLADLAAGRPRSLSWLGQAVLWIGLVAGIAGGTGLVALMGQRAPWVPAGVALGIAVLAPVLRAGKPSSRG
jgi:uncharacterized membrane protein YoaK (UPF0700 family)